MGERKVLNKYIPPDFDPRLVPKTKWDPFKQIETRMMLPFNIQCDTCGEFMGRGKKFTMKKEDVHGDDYKGIKKFRFYLKCTVCAREITFITDPENMDYAIEHGAKRMFEIWKENERMEKEAIKAREDEEKADAMKALEHRTIDSKIEMDIMDALEECKAMSAKRDAIRPDDMLAMRQQEDQAAVDALAPEEEKLIQEAFGGNNKTTVRRLDESDEEEDSKPRAQPAKPVLKPPDPPKPMIKPLINVKIKKRKIGESPGGGGGGPAAKEPRSQTQPTTSTTATASAQLPKDGKPVGTSVAPAPPSQPPAAGALGGLLGLGGYGSSDSD